MIQDLSQGPITWSSFSSDDTYGKDFKGVAYLRYTVIDL